MFGTALAQTEQAFTDGDSGVERAIGNMLDYYDPSSGYSGASFLQGDADSPYAITPGDLWAVSTLSMSVPPGAGRALMNPGPLNWVVVDSLRRLPPTLPLRLATPTDLELMRELYSSIRTMLPPLGKRDTTNQWVFAAKICARKRPLLFPVRDSKVCTYLAGGVRMGGKHGQMGSFSRDVQVLGYLVDHPRVREALGDVRRGLHQRQPTWSIDWADLRLLDVVLWMRADGHTTASAT